MLRFKKIINWSQKASKNLHTTTKRHFSKNQFNDLVYQYKSSQRKEKSKSLKIQIDKSDLQKVSSEKIQNYLVADLGYNLKMLEFNEFPFKPNQKGLFTPLKKQN